MIVSRRQLAAGIAGLPLVAAASRAALAQDRAPQIGSGTDRAQTFATQAYVFGYPLITMELTRRVSTNIAAPKGARAPMGQFANLREYPDADFRTVTAPNADTLYSLAWLDLATEPYVLSLPAMGDRYFLFPMLDAWTNVFAVPGARTTGGAAQRYVIAGPDWKGTLNEPIEIVRAPTNMVWVLGRVYCTGTPEDYRAVHALQDQFTLTPLSALGRSFTPPAGKVDPAIDMTSAVRSQVNKMDARAYFGLLASLMKANPTGLGDGIIAAKLAALGIVPGQAFDPDKLDPGTRAAVEDAPARGQAAILAQEARAGLRVNGWIFATRTGFYGQDYAQRAFITAVGLGANLPQDAIYPMTKVDAEGRPLSGKNRYVIRFEPGQLPPVKGFWSLTMYDSAMFFVANPLNRYSISPRVDPKPNADGSVDLLIQNVDPGADKHPNWLPAPAGPFVLMFRFYEPGGAILDGTWEPPAVEKR
jgi:hypothetical protein